MNWIDQAMAIPSSKSEIVEKLDNDGYTYPHYSRVMNATVLIVDKLSLQRDCDRLGLQLSDVWPRQIELL